MATTKKQPKVKTTEEFVLQAVKTLRADPAKYAAVRHSLRNAKTDKARVKSLLKFATSEKDLAALLPSRGTSTAFVTVTTVTVTTIFIPDTAY